MFKQAFRSYLATLRFKNIKRLRDSAAYGYIYIMFLIIYGSAALLQDNGIADVYCLIFLRALVPLGLMGWSNLGSKYLMPKAQFLCPMKEADRKEYINCVLMIKIGAMVASSLCVELIWSLFFGFDWWKLILVPLLFAGLGVAEYMGYGIKPADVGQIPSVIIDKHGNRVSVWMNTVSAIIAVLLLGFITGYDMEQLMIGQNGNENGFSIWFVAMAVCMIFIVIFSVLIIKNQYKHVIVESSDYELHFKIKGKVKSPKKYDMFAKR